MDIFARKESISPVLGNQWPRYRLKKKIEIWFQNKNIEISVQNKKHKNKKECERKIKIDKNMNSK